MSADYSQFWAVAIAALAVFVVYRRLRRTFGRQLLNPVRMRLRCVLLIIVGCTLLPAALGNIRALTLDAAGLALGAALAAWGAKRTRFQRTDGRLYYLPHTYTGVVVSLLLIGRLAYRMAALYGLRGGMGALADPTGAPAMVMRSPLTLGIFGVVVGYYVCYYGLVLSKAKRIGPEDLEAVAASPAVAP